MKTITIDKLKAIFAEQGRSQIEQMRLSDIFATACFLHALGYERAGRKLLNELFDQLGSFQRKTYFDQLIYSLRGNEKTYALGVTAHSEIRDMFEIQMEIHSFPRAT